VSGFDPSLTVSRFKECLGGRRQAQHTLLVFLAGIALADGTLSSAERTALNQIAALLSVPQREIDQLLSMINAQAQFQQRAYQQQGGRHRAATNEPSGLDTAYAALGVAPDASNSELKRRYRKLMSENHPDKLIAEGVPDELLRVATARAQEITAAYEVIQQSRGLK
jgi:DnaJ like chaperone protein